jgi:hypothetical protein
MNSLKKITTVALLIAALPVTTFACNNGNGNSGSHSSGNGNPGNGNPGNGAALNGTSHAFSGQLNSGAITSQVTGTTIGSWSTGVNTSVSVSNNTVSATSVGNFATSIITVK